MHVFRVVALGVSFVCVSAVAAQAQSRFAVFYENDPRLDDPCKFVFVNIAGTVLPGGSNNYLEYPAGSFDTLAQAQLARDRILIEASPAVTAITYSSRCRKAWSVDRDNATGMLYMRDQTVVGARAGMKVEAQGLCGREAAAMVRAGNGANGPGPAYGFDICLAPGTPGGILQFTGGKWVKADGKPAALPALKKGKGKKMTGWVSLGVSDCTGQDVGKTSGTPKPDGGMCTKAQAGSVAVCWDGVRYLNPPSGGTEMWCTYKSATAGSCKGGSAPGYIYECRAD